MATGGKVLDAVMKFARNSGVFVSPKGPNSAIDPALSTLTDKQYVEIWRELHLALDVAGIHTEIPLSDMRDAETWRQLAQLAYDGQAG